MSHDFKVTLPSNWEKRLSEFEKYGGFEGIIFKRKGNNISVEGNSPLGKIAADIEISGKTAFVKITKKPFILLKSKIESEVRKALKNLK